MPSNITPRITFTTWDKVALYALDRLTVNASAGSPRWPVTWFSTAAIKSKARSLIVVRNIASVSSNSGAVGAVSSCLNRLAVIGIVNKDRICIHGRRRIAYRLNRNNYGVTELLHALADEVSQYHNFDSNFEQTRLAYLSLYNVWRQHGDSMLSEVTAHRNTTVQAATTLLTAGQLRATIARRQAAQAQVNNTNELDTIYAKRRQQALKELELS